MKGIFSVICSFCTVMGTRVKKFLIVKYKINACKNQKKGYTYRDLCKSELLQEKNIAFIWV